MSFSITTLRGFVIKTSISSGGVATLETPTASLFDCGECKIRVGMTITGPTGSVIKFKIGQYADSINVSCDDYDFITTGNTAYLNGNGGTNEFSCLDRMPNGFMAKFIACNGSEFSEVLTVDGVPIDCPSTIPDPSINILSSFDNGDGTSSVSYEIVSNYCHNTYFTDSDGTLYNYMNCGQGAADPDSLNYLGVVQGSGQIGGPYVLTCTSSTFYEIKAVTYFNEYNQYPDCTSNITSNIVSANGYLP